MVTYHHQRYRILYVHRILPGSHSYNHELSKAQLIEMVQRTVGVFIDMRYPFFRRNAQ